MIAFTYKCEPSFILFKVRSELLTSCISLLPIAQSLAPDRTALVEYFVKSITMIGRERIETTKVWFAQQILTLSWKEYAINEVLKIIYC